MKDTPNTSLRASSPTRTREIAAQPSARRVVGYEGASVSVSSQGDSPPAARKYGLSSSASRMSPLGENVSSQRYHPESGRTSIPPRYASPGFPDSPFYPQPQQSPVDVLSSQVATLEDRVQRLTDMLNTERIDSVRSNLDTVSHLLQVTGWFESGKGAHQS